MKKIKVDCKECQRAFYAGWNYAKNKRVEFCSQACVGRYRGKHRTTNHAPVHIDIDRSHVLIRSLASYGFLTKENVKLALRRATDQAIIGALS